MFENVVKHFFNCFVCLLVWGSSYDQGVKREKKSSKSMLMNGYPYLRLRSFGVKIHICLDYSASKEPVNT